MARRDKGAPRELSPAQERMLKTVYLGDQPRAVRSSTRQTLALLMREGYMLLAGGKYFISTAGEVALKRATDRRAELALKAEPPRMSAVAADTKARDVVRSYLVNAFPDYPHLHTIRGAAERKLVKTIARELREASRP